MDEEKQRDDTSPTTRGCVRNVILDLDNTLISAIARDKFDAMSEERRSLLRRTFRSVDMDDDYVVFERPGLQRFLNFLFGAGFNVGVWTAASKDYATFIVNNFIQSCQDDDDDDVSRRHCRYRRRLWFIMFNDHCKLSESVSDCHKDIAKILSGLDACFELAKTIIVDDDEGVERGQPNNAIRVRPFDVESSSIDQWSANDDELERVVRARLERELKACRRRHR